MPGSDALAVPIATEPSNELTVRRNASTWSTPVSRWRDMRVGITLASVVIGAAIRRLWATRRSAWLSTSPFRAATTYGGIAPPGCSSSTELSGWVFGSLMIPTLAQRV